MATWLFVLCSTVQCHGVYPSATAVMTTEAQCRAAVRFYQSLDNYTTACISPSGEIDRTPEKKRR